MTTRSRSHIGNGSSTTQNRTSRTGYRISRSGTNDIQYALHQQANGSTVNISGIPSIVLKGTAMRKKGALGHAG